VASSAGFGFSLGQSAPSLGEGTGGLGFGGALADGEPKFASPRPGEGAASRATPLPGAKTLEGFSLQELATGFSPLQAFAEPSAEGASTGSPQVLAQDTALALLGPGAAASASKRSGPPAPTSFPGPDLPADADEELDKPAGPSKVCVVM